MYKGKYSRERRRRPALWAALALALVLTLSVGGTVAYLFDNTDSVVNTFTPAETKIEIDEPNWDGKVKNNVTIKNTGDIDVYVRAMVVVTWQDKDGNVYATTPVEGTDYTVTWTKNGWTEGADGYYYYTSKVAPNASTGVLLTNCQPVEGKAPENYHLVVDILAQAIQAEPESAIQEAWGITLDSNGNIPSSK